MINTYDGKKRFALEIQKGTQGLSDDKLLQVSLPNKILIYDPKHDQPKEVFSVIESNFFV